MNCSPRRAKNGMLIIKRQRSHAPDRSVWHWQLDWFESSDMFTFILSFLVKCFKSRCRRKGEIFETSRKQQFILRRLRHEKFLFTRRPGASVSKLHDRPRPPSSTFVRPSFPSTISNATTNDGSFGSRHFAHPTRSPRRPALFLLGLTESRSRAHTSIVWVQSRAFFAQDVRRVTIQKAIMNLTNDKLH